MDPEAVKRLNQVILETYVDGFKRVECLHGACEGETMIVHAAENGIAGETEEAFAGSRHGLVQQARDLCKRDNEHT